MYALMVSPSPSVLSPVKLGSSRRCCASMVIDRASSVATSRVGRHWYNCLPVPIDYTWWYTYGCEFWGPQITGDTTPSTNCALPWLSTSPLSTTPVCLSLHTSPLSHTCTNFSICLPACVFSIAAVACRSPASSPPTPQTPLAPELHLNSLILLTSLSFRSSSFQVSVEAV